MKEPYMWEFPVVQQVKDPAFVTAAVAQVWSLAQDLTCATDAAPPKKKTMEHSLCIYYHGKIYVQLLVSAKKQNLQQYVFNYPILTLYMNICIE